MLEWLIESSPERLAELFCDRLQKMFTPGRPLAVALTGGNSAKPFYQEMARRYGPQPGTGWDAHAIDYYWSDERLVPPESEDSNYRLARDILLLPSRIRFERIHRMPTEAPPENCAERYADQLRRAFADRSQGTPRLPLILLGLGPDGHTASLFPGTDLMFENDRLVRVARQTRDNPHDRLTFTPRLINAAQQVWFLITGRQKADAVARLYERQSTPRETPALIVDPAVTDITYFADAAAAAQIRPK